MKKKHRKQLKKTNEWKSWFFEKIFKTDRTLAQLMKRKKEVTEINEVCCNQGNNIVDT